MRSVLIFLLLLGTGIVKGATNDNERIPSVMATESPVLDGVLDDVLWSYAKSVSGFKTFVPDFSKDMPFKTIAFWSHDQDNLYFGFKCFDDPDLVKTSIAARDRIGDDDWVCINLDSFNDRQTLYSFYINPNGIQMDSRMAGNREDSGIDMVWYSAGKIDEDGYSVEVKIPFKSIRYAVKDGRVDMGVIFERKMSRFSTQGTYPELDPKQGLNFLNQTMPLRYEGVKKSVLLELLPAFTYGQSITMEEGKQRQDQQADLSLTAKYGITSDLILDATYNPDFSQVEADFAQIEVNQRFPVFYPEKRPFFLEGSEHLGHAGGSGRQEVRSIVNTRTIVNPIAAGKLTGKIGRSNIISSIAAVDELDTSFNANVGVVRYKRVFQKDSYLGGFLTGRTQSDFSNMVYGTDGQFRIGDASLISGNLFSSHTVESIETSPENEYASALNYSFRNRKVSFGVGYTNISENFQSAVGQVTRTGIAKYTVFYNPKFYPKQGVIKRIDPMLYLSVTKDKPSGLYESSLFSRISITLPLNTQIRLGGNKSSEVYEAQIFDRSRVELSARSQLTKRIFLSGQYGFNNRPYYDTPEQGTGKSARAEAGLQISDNFNAQMEYNYSDLKSKETGEPLFTVHILRSKNTYQFNKYLFFRAIVQYNSYTKVLAPNLLASFTYIPGTVVHLGYGSIYEQSRWDASVGDNINSRDFRRQVQGFFFKASYLFRA